ncbi:PilZ domain-containing protein [Shewanella sp. 1_MG-2023]|uniref:PilZ domain-containing protein n=1 Tax=unclassified Shewanella TaxID=196818 RepID=UPI0026E3EA83|nr:MULTISPECIES: PilZ domain-containing protein [unclassified Shewanella]MDO6610310.1 PilZ domain-containing protein [Shewanella sp. 7_MG-2023]MDO6770435.1 PilZ domain-containing protein [Shewanella sp. 2_MG-2023]MDO6794322.1 PilZ domain-containing protein [Shewanella sp. 1_MG-2023]
MSIEDHSQLIEQLKPLLMEPDFKDVFEKLTIDESNSTRFLLKMELNRLSAICTRIIDLRDKTELHCEEVSVAKQRHFLDEPAKASLAQALQIYRNKYTIGVYEHVLNEHRHRKEQLRLNKQEPAIESSELVVPGVVMGSYFNRSEERMNYSIRISASQDGGADVIGASLDLSVGGARVRLPAKHRFDQDKPLRIKLLELNEEFFFEDLQNGVDYQIVDIQNKDDSAIMRLRRMGDSVELDKVLTQLIRGYKFRYKVDVNDVIVNATGLGFERHYLPMLAHMPLYISVADGKPFISHKLLSRGNQPILQYFLDEKEVSQLPSMLTNNRLVNLLKYPEETDHSLFFCFTHQAKGVTQYFSASLHELKQHNAMQLFFGFGAAKESWRIYKVAQQKVDHKLNYKTSTLPGDESQYSALTEQQLARFSYILQIVDLTNEDVRPNYRAWFNEGDNVNSLKIFNQLKLKKNTVKRLSMPFSERRREGRFAFKTIIEIEQEGKKSRGITHDISTRGLQFTLEDNTQFTSPAEVSLHFPKLQAIAGKTELKNLPYQLIRSRNNHQTLHLSAIVGHEPHAGVEFINKLINHNRDKFEQLSDDEGELKELADGMKNLLLRQLVGVPYFVEKTKKSAQLACIGIGTKNDEISHLFAAGSTQPLSFNLTPLFDEAQFKQHIIDPIRAMKPIDGVEYFEIFMQISRQGRGAINIQSQLMNDFNSRNAQISFIHHAQSVGRFMALRVYFGATEKTDMSYIRREMEYITIHAKHRAKQLEERLWQVIGSGELLDITAEVEVRFPELHIENSVNN